MPVTPATASKAQRCWPRAGSGEPQGRSRVPVPGFRRPDRSLPRALRGAACRVSCPRTRAGPTGAVPERAWDPERACPIDLLHEFWAGRNRSIKGLENHQGPRAGRVWAQARGTPLPSPGLSPGLRGSTATPRFLQKEAVAARTPGPRQAAQPLRLEQGAVWTQPGSDPACHGPRHRRHRTRAAAGAGPSRGLPDRHLWGLPARSRGRPRGMRHHGGGEGNGSEHAPSARRRRKGTVRKAGLVTNDSASTRRASATFPVGCHK